MYTLLSGRSIFFTLQLDKIKEFEVSIILENLKAISMSPNGNTIICNFLDGTNMIYDYETEQRIHLWRNKDLKEARVEVSMNGRYAVIAGISQIEVWDLKAKKNEVHQEVEILKECLQKFHYDFDDFRELCLILLMKMIPLFEWFFFWKPSQIVEKIQTNELNVLLKDCRHPHIHKYLYWIANKVSSEDNYAKRKFDRFMKEQIETFRQKWDTKIIP